MYTISRLSRQFGLSRSTLLYYDRIGLLCPSDRSQSKYRLYSEADRQRLQSICSFRQAGLTIDDIRSILSSCSSDIALILQDRLHKLGSEIRGLQAQQQLLAAMLKMESGVAPNVTVDKETWVAMLRAAGMDERGMQRWHQEFEQRAPEAHHQFLLSLGILEQEALLIRGCNIS